MLGQAKQRLSRVLSLRNDSGRLSLESVLSGTALGLALLYLLNDMGAAAHTTGAGQPAAGSGPMGGGDPASSAAGSSATRAGQEGAPEGIQGAEREPPHASPLGDASGGLGPASRLVGRGARGEPQLDSFRTAGQGVEPNSGAMSAASASAAEPGLGARTLAPGSSVVPSNNGGAAPTGSLGTAPSPSGAPSPPSDPQGWEGGGSADPLVSADQPAAPQLTARQAPVPDPLVPGFRVVLRSSEGSVSRSVEGPSSSEYRHSLGTITDAAIDLRQRESPQVLVSSVSQLHLLALSQLGDATLTLASNHIGLDRARLLLGPEVNAISIQLYETIDAGLIAGMAARSQIQQSVIALRDSLLQDSGPGGSLAISSLARFLLKAPGDGLQRQLGIDLLAEAMQNSTILLGDGNDRVTLTSGFRDLEGTSPGLLIDIPNTTGNHNDPSLQLRARAIGLEDSRLDTGGGNDQVSIKTWLDPTAAGIPSSSGDLGRIALLHSSVLLGAGNDQLDVEGAVLDSHLNLGSGDNQVSIDGAVQQSSVLLGPDSRNQLTLAGDTNNSLNLALAPGERAAVTLLAGAGNDRIGAPLDGLAGTIDGGGGFNTLEATAADQKGAPVDPLRVSLQAPGAGTVGALGFSRFDTLRVASKDLTVSVAAQAELSGALVAAGVKAGQGHATLDYSTWQAPVLVNLVLGMASGILGGIGGFQEVIGGSGDDQLTAGATTSRLDGGPGKDTIQLNLAAHQALQGCEIFGGNGRDTFVLSGLDAIKAGNAAGEPALPPVISLADLGLETTASGGIGLSDTLQWRQQGIQTAPGGAVKTLTLTSAGLEGLGQPQLLPIAPLAQLLAGMAALPLGGQQLAIAAGPNHSSLLLLGGDRSYSTIADLPSLRINTSSQPTPSTAVGPSGLSG